MGGARLINRITPTTDATLPLHPRREFEQLGNADERLRFLLRYATLAPSSHNTQPWLWRIEGDGVELRGDAKLLHSAIENVVRNAIRYTKEKTAVQIELRRNENEAVLVVRDQGAGVPEAALENLFRPFYRVSAGRDRQSGGVGLGLAIAERAPRSRRFGRSA